MDNLQSVWESHLADFAVNVASVEPTPGGGSVAGVVGSLGIGLMIMSIEVTRNKLQDENQLATLKEASERLSELMEGLQKKADQDIEVFQRYMIALRMPKSSPEEKVVRTQALRSAAVAAATIPTEAIQLAYEALALAGDLVPLIDKGIVSDLGAGVAFLRSSIQANALNVRINLGGIVDEAAIKHFQSVLNTRVPEAEREADLLYAQVVARLS